MRSGARLWWEYYTRRARIDELKFIDCRPKCVRRMHVYTCIRYDYMYLYIYIYYEHIIIYIRVSASHWKPKNKKKKQGNLKPLLIRMFKQWTFSWCIHNMKVEEARRNYTYTIGTCTHTCNIMGDEPRAVIRYPSGVPSLLLYTHTRVYGDHVILGVYCSVRFRKPVHKYTGARVCVCGRRLYQIPVQRYTHVSQPAVPPTPRHCKWFCGFEKTIY